MASRKGILDEKLELFSEIVDEVVKRLAIEGRARIFNLVLVPWMIINQRAMNLSLERVVGRLKRGEFKGLLDDGSKRVRENKISHKTGGFSQARKALSEEVVTGICDGMTEALLEQHESRLWHGKQAILVDGTTVGLYATAELKKGYPPSKNQYGESHWSTPKMLLLHDMVTGIALRPEFGATSGAHARSETEMLHAAIKRCPEGAIIVGDANFGILRVVDSAQQNQHPALVRLTESRAGKFLRNLSAPGECRVTWVPTSSELKKYGEIAPQSGRFIWVRLEKPGYRGQDLYFFTTLSESAEEITNLYRRRWDIEQDIRSLKCTMELDKVVVRTPEMFRKEFMLGVLAYNLVRDTMAVVAKAIGIDPRRLSFKAYLFELQSVHSIHASGEGISREKILNFWIQTPWINQKRDRPPQIRATRHSREKFPPLKGNRKITSR